MAHRSTHKTMNNDQLETSCVLTGWFRIDSGFAAPFVPGNPLCSQAISRCPWSLAYTLQGKCQTVLLWSTNMQLSALTWTVMTALTWVCNLTLKLAHFLAIQTKHNVFSVLLACHNNGNATNSNTLHPRKEMQRTLPHDHWWKHNC